MAKTLWHSIPFYTWDIWKARDRERALFLPRRSSCRRHEVCPSLFFIDLGFASIWHVNHPLSVYFCYYNICCYYLFPYLSAISSTLFLSQSVVSAFFSHQRGKGSSLWFLMEVLNWGIQFLNREITPVTNGKLVSI